MSVAKLEIGKVYLYGGMRILIIYVGQDGQGAGLRINKNYTRTSLVYTFEPSELTLDLDQTHGITINIKPHYPRPKVGDIWEDETDIFLLVAYSPEIKAFACINTNSLVQTWKKDYEFNNCKPAPHCGVNIELLARDL